MKIAYVGNFSQRHCTETHLALTLEKLGHEVIRLQENEVTEGALSAMIITEDWDLFLFTRTWDTLVTMDHLAQLRERKIPSASYHLDLYVGLKREDGLDQDPFWRTDFVFTPDGSQQAAEVFKAKSINHYYMKPGVYEDECYIAEPDNYGLDVVFVGGGEATGVGQQYGHKEWPYRGKLIKFLRDTYGDDFHKFGWPQATIRNEELNQLYANSKIVVGDSLCLNFDHPYYWSDRVYETMGRGGFIIHPFIEGMQEEFTNGKNIVFYEYNNWEQLKEKIDYYLEHDDEREAIRKAGHEFVKANATYTQRLQQMLNVIFPIASPKTDERGDNGAIKIHLGAGTEILGGYINTDIVDLPGIDKVFNVMHFPWPFEDGCADEIKAKDLIEHLPTHTNEYENSLNKFIEEAHRILKPSGLLWIQTPSWDADFLWVDYTHVRGYDIRSMDFFDPDTDFGRATGFYGKAKFKVMASKSENNNLTFEMVKR